MFNVLLRDMNVDVPASDGRRIEVLAQDLPCFSGTQLAIDITLRSPLTSAGEVHPNAADTDGAVLLQARRDKETTYPELTAGRCKLVVLGIETGGRWAEEGRNSCDNSSWPSPGKFQHTWTRLLSTVCATSFAARSATPFSGGLVGAGSKVIVGELRSID